MNTGVIGGLPLPLAGLTAEAFLSLGGFPKIVLSRGDLSLRQQYFLDIVERDITNRVGARSSVPVRAVIQMVFGSCASEMSLRRVAATCGLSVETGSSYLSAAESAYLLYQAFPSSYEGRFLSGQDLTENFAAGWS